MNNLIWRRKAIRIKSTFYIAVPLPWAEANIKKGDGVLIKMNADGSLRISPEVLTNE